MELNGTQLGSLQNRFRPVPLGSSGLSYCRNLFAPLVPYLASDAQDSNRGLGSSSELRRQIPDVCGNHIEIAKLSIIRLTGRSVFIGPVDESGAQTESPSGIQIG